jgi:hypothetical protein
MAKLSVIIPTYNRSRLVVDAIDSVIAQRTDHALEIIVVDDGSQDDTREVLRKYAGRIEYRHQPNRGMNAARNYGVRKASGEYVAFLDSDDAWLPFKADMQIAVMDRLPNVGFAFSNFYAWRNGLRSPNGLAAWMVPGASFEEHVTQRFSSVALDVGELEPFSVACCEIYRLSLYQPVVLPSTSIVRRQVFDEIGLLAEDNWMCGDWEFFARASKKFGAAYIDKETALNRSHDDPVRLMRRALKERTKQRIESIRRTWRSDEPFMSEFGTEVDRVESQEWRTLFKCACYDGDVAAAREHMRQLRRLSGTISFELRALWWLMQTAPTRLALADLHRRMR